MPRITLPDGSVKEFAGTTTGAEVAASIGAGLAKAAVAVEVDGIAQDLSEPIGKDVSLKIATAKTELGLDTMRHTLAAQVLALAIKLHYPEAELAIGPTIDNGFYYDIDFKGMSLSSDALPEIESKMREIIAQKRNIIREMWPAEQLRQHFSSWEEPYKVELIDDAIAKGQLINGRLSAYRHVDTNNITAPRGDFIDFCRGPHVPNLEKLSTIAFKLTHLAGAYWRGDSNNRQLTRIYVVAFASQKEMDAYLTMREEAEKRDHRKLGRELELFHLQEEAAGQPFWHPKGWAMFVELEHYIRANLRRYDYREVNTPKLVSNKLFELSGHWANYREDMFLVCDEVNNLVSGDTDKEKSAAKVLANSAGGENLSLSGLKPMNCPCHVQIFNQGIKSYRDLPLRMSEFGMCMRNEAHGALHGLMRVKSLTQDDAHIFCTPEQMEEEIITLCKLIDEVYEPLGFKDYSVKLATRPEKRVGDDSLWDASEKALADACAKIGIPLTLAPGDGAFYGPKLEYHLKDAIGRTWQCGTIQVDFNTPRRMGATYTNEAGERVPPVMIHRAILGTFERFLGILIEHHEGKFPVWLAPEQAVVIPITDGQNDYAAEVKKKLMDANVVNGTGGLRVEIDTSNERMQKKILFAQQRKVPYMLVVGKKETEDGTVAVRLRDGTDLGAKPLDWLIGRMKTEVETRKDA